MTNSRDQILAAIKESKPAATPLPDLSQDWIRFEDPVSQFENVLEAVGGRLIRLPRLEATAPEFTKLAAELGPEKVFSLVPELLSSTFEIEDVTDPHQLEDVDLAILRGEIAVAENAAVWIDERAMRHRAILFISQHIVLTVTRDQLVHNQHEAYERLRFGERQFGLFVSGPSKTADIEQSLVVGAHGARSLTVILTDQ